MGDGLEKTWEGLLSTLGEKAMDGLGDYPPGIHS